MGVGLADARLLVEKYRSKTRAAELADMVAAVRRKSNNPKKKKSNMVTVVFMWYHWCCYQINFTYMQ